MKSSAISSFPVVENHQDDGKYAYGFSAGNVGGQNNYDLLIPEGRVHGGGLMSLLGGNLKNVLDGI
jgi:hypothetical protein